MMGSVKSLVMVGSVADRFFEEPKHNEFGIGAWKVSGNFSVADLKDMIPPSTIKDKAEALTMTTARFFEWLSQKQPDIETCYLGVLNKDGELVDTTALLDKGETTDTIVMKLAHTPDSYSINGDLQTYRKDLAEGILQCGVADVESIFRHGFPLGSSTFKKIFKAAGYGKDYESLSTYNETAEFLDEIRNLFSAERKLKFPELEKLLQQSGLGNHIPDPGFVLKDIIYDTTTKFEAAGDRDITEQEARLYSGLSDKAHEYWKKDMFPKIARAQIAFCDQRNILNIDGKCECVAYRRNPVLTDFACTSDENRLMIIVNRNGEEWAIPSNKEIQRAIFRKEGIYSAIEDAKAFAKQNNDLDNWRVYLGAILEGRKIDLKEVAEHSCNLMSYAIGEVANRLLEKNVFDAKPIDTWVDEFMPYASKIYKER